MVLHNCTAGRCCLYRAILRAELPRSLVNCKFVKGWVSNTIATAPRWPSMAPHRGASGRASVYSTPWPPTCSGALPTRCTIEVAPLLSLHRGCCNPGCPWAPKPYVHPSAQRKAQGSHSRSCGFTAMVYGKLLNTQPGTLCKMHPSVTRSEGGQLPR